MPTEATSPGLKVPLAAWASLHPAALAAPPAELAGDGAAGSSTPRSAALAEALATANARWGNRVDGELGAWLDGAEVVVTGQQPGLLGGPLLTLVKACAVAAEVRRRRAAGRSAVGFLWLATADDDLPEMGWARLAFGETLAEAREAGWQRGGGLGGEAKVGTATAELLERARGELTTPLAAEALDLAAACYAPGASLGEATARLLAGAMRSLGIVLVDACEAELAKASATPLVTVLADLERAWEALEDGERETRARGWSPALRLARTRLPIFRRNGAHREPLASRGGACPAVLLAEVERHPERFVPNVWLRPLVQDAALGTSAALLGGAELAYHLQGRALWRLAGLPRPEWRLRPHVTVVTTVERRLARQLRVEPEHLLRTAMPRHLLPGTAVRKIARRLSGLLERQMDELEAAAGRELPGLKGDLEATRRRLESGMEWLEDRVEKTATRTAEVEGSRWRRLLASLRPHSKPQERELSALAPLLRLGLGWPEQLAAALDPGDPGMHLLFWEEGGAW